MVSNADRISLHSLILSMSSVAAICVLGIQHVVTGDAVIAVIAAIVSFATGQQVSAVSYQTGRTAGENEATNGTHVAVVTPTTTAEVKKP